MGTEYYFADTKNKRIFHLGRGFWPLVNQAVNGRTDVDSMCNAAFEDWVDRYGYEEMDERTPVMLRILGESLWSFCKVADWQVEFRNDCTNYPDEFDSSEQPLYKHVFSRYNDGYIDADPCLEQMQVFLEIAAVTRPQFTAKRGRGGEILRRRT